MHFAECLASLARENNERREPESRSFPKYVIIAWYYYTREGMRVYVEKTRQYIVEQIFG